MAREWRFRSRNADSAEGRIACAATKTASSSSSTVKNDIIELEASAQGCSSFTRMMMMRTEARQPIAPTGQALQKNHPLSPVFAWWRKQREVYHADCRIVSSRELHIRGLHEALLNHAPRAGNSPAPYADPVATVLAHRPFPAAVMQLEDLAVSHVSMDLRDHLPRRLGCRAALWDGSVYLYGERSECVAVVPLKAGEMPTPELITQRVGLGTWKLVRDWRPRP